MLCVPLLAAGVGRHSRSVALPGHLVKSTSPVYNTVNISYHNSTNSYGDLSAIAFKSFGEESHGQRKLGHSLNWRFLQSESSCVVKESKYSKTFKNRMNQNLINKFNEWKKVTQFQPATCIPCQHSFTYHKQSVDKPHLKNILQRVPKRFYSTSNTTFNPSVAEFGESTIFSLSSGHGKCGVAIVRVSGAQVSEVVRHVVRLRKMPTPRMALVRKLMDPETQEAIDKALVLYFPGPGSFTGEDCLELHVHGGPAVIAALITALGKVSGCRQAEPGEFSKRAFQNGKLDLTEVEGLGDLIHAETESQRKQALRQMDGDLSQLYTHWRHHFIKCVADLEAYIDFGEDQHIEDTVTGQVSAKVDGLRGEIIHHLHDNRQGERLREGVHVTIIGEPNVGKSSLLNLICQRPVAIVTEIAGTTRDVIETAVNIGGYPVLLSDTAGLRETHDIVEKEGVLRAVKRAQQADVRVIVYDLGSFNWKLHGDLDIDTFIARQLTSFGITSVNTDNDDHSKTNLKQGDLLNSESECFNNADTIIVFNKSDLMLGYKPDLSANSTLNNSDTQCLKENMTMAEAFCKVFGAKDLNINNEADINNNNNVVDELDNKTSTKVKGQGHANKSRSYEGRTFSSRSEDVPIICCISCVTTEGINSFLNILKNKVAKMCGNPLVGHPSLTQARHRHHLVKCLEHLDQFDHMITADDIVLASQALRRSLREIGKITGKITSEEILDVIFRDFCIGK